MAANLSKLDAINKMLETAGIKPVAALDTNGFSEASDAERVLDRESKLVQMEGHYGNRIMAKEWTAASSKIVLTANVVLAIKSAGRSQHRNLVYRMNGADAQVYDLDNETFSFTTGEKVYLDTTYLIAFADAGIDLQAIILERAMQIYQRRFVGNPEKDAELAEERLRAESNINRTAGRAGSDRSSPAPFALQNPRGGGQG